MSTRRGVGILVVVVGNCVIRKESRKCEAFHCTSEEAMQDKASKTTASQANRQIALSAASMWPLLALQPTTHWGPSGARRLTTTCWNKQCWPVSLPASQAVARCCQQPTLPPRVCRLGIGQCWYEENLGLPKSKRVLTGNALANHGTLTGFDA